LLADNKVGLCKIIYTKLEYFFSQLRFPLLSSAVRFAESISR